MTPEMACCQIAGIDIPKSDTFDIKKVLNSVIIERLIVVIMTIVFHRWNKHSKELQC